MVISKIIGRHYTKKADVVKVICGHLKLSIIDTGLGVLGDGVGRGVMGSAGSILMQRL